MKEVIKETLLGVEEPADLQLSAQTRATFEKNARKDEQTGELFMGEEDFVNAVAPPGEDYVSPNLVRKTPCRNPNHTSPLSTRSSGNSMRSSSKWLTDGKLVRSVFMTGAPLKTSS